MKLIGYSDFSLFLLVRVETPWVPSLLISTILIEEAKWTTCLILEKESSFNFPLKKLKWSEADKSFTKQAWNRLRNGGSRGFPGYFGV